MKLTNQERASGAWRTLEAYLNDRLDVLRRQNDGDLPADATARLRGRITQIKEILALGADVPGQVQPDADA